MRPFVVVSAFSTAGAPFASKTRSSLKDTVPPLYTTGLELASVNLMLRRGRLSRKQIEVCDFFVYIPQYGAGTASLNVTVAASIVLQHFAVWAGLKERERQGQKFLVAERPTRRQSRGVCSESPETVGQIRRENRALIAGATLLFDDGGGIIPEVGFDADGGGCCGWDEWQDELNQSADACLEDSAADTGDNR
ncbi:hypothetical protein CBR_g29509 [Chara braunii]|uniref:tRNA/rRNA methyltransferase SpoU type domain-containing protein n=1 Tax=Chara braunii TaxID=69332 RepID=A0A388LAM3_CHABU|nr:hypothetical protein CBR_g29509 [Chara braunii]|eukprot:GBG79361.1 hypothetical protein CBR_g29509 [Chara braunii]